MYVGVAGWGVMTTEHKKKIVAFYFASRPIDEPGAAVAVRSLNPGTLVATGVAGDS